MADLDRRFLDACSIGAYRCDRSGQLIAANEAAGEIVGTRLQPGSRLDELFGPQFVKELPPVEEDHHLRTIVTELSDGAGRISLEHHVVSRTENGESVIDGIFWARVGEAAVERDAAYRALWTMVENTPGVAIHVFDTEGRVQLWNNASEDLYGFDRDQIVGRKLQETLDEEQAENFLEALSRVRETGETIPPHIWEVERRDGGRRTVISTMFPFPVRPDSVLVGCMDVDITNESILRREVDEQHSRLRFLLEQLPLVVWTTDEKLTVSFIAGSGLHLVMESPERLLGMAIEDLARNRDLSGSFLRAHQDALKGHPASFEHRWDDRWYQTHLEPLRDASRAIIGVSGVAQNITPDKLRAERFVEQSRHDALTGLPSREILHERTASNAAYAIRHRELLGLILLDLDEFSRVNRALGHDLADQILREVASRLTESLRTEDTVARLGANRFGLLLPGLKDRSELATIAHKLLSLIRQPMSFTQDEIRITASAGMASLPDQCADAELLLQSAETALAEAKRAGHNSIREYSDETGERSWPRLQMESALYDALERGELGFHYQPIVHLESGRIVMVEALLRWNHTVRGELAAGIFIDTAENSALMIELGEWTVREVCRQIKQWKGSSFDLPVALNLSSRQLQDIHFAEQLEAILHELDLPGQSLDIEITETAAMGNLQNARLTVDRLRRIGCGVTLDDFGTGYSSLSHLTEFALNGLKIDRSFVSGLDSGRTGEAVTSAIVAAAGSLGLRVVAEGIETEAQRKRLAELGCSHGQGYLFSRPCPPGKLTELVANWNREAG